MEKLELELNNDSATNSGILAQMYMLRSVLNVQTAQLHTCCQQINTVRYVYALSRHR